MRESNDVFELIKSLTKSEKRYFKINSESGSSYVKLFDAVDSMPKYDEEQLKKKFPHETFIKNLAYNKLYLYNEILSSLSHFHSKNSVEAEIRELIAKIEVLKQKGLMLQARKLINKAYELASHEEKQYYLLLILSGKAGLKSLITNPDERETFTEEIVNRQYEILDEVKNQMDYYSLSTRMLKFMNVKGGIRTREDRNEINGILKDTLLKDISYAKSIDAKCYFYFTKHLCYLNLKDFDKAYENSRLGIELLRGADMGKSLMRARARTALGAHLLLMKYFPEKDEEFITSLREYRNAVYPDRNKIPGRFIDSYNSEILFNIKKGDYQKNSLILAVLEENLSELKNYKKVSEYFFLCSNAAYSEFICGNYSQSLKWLNTALKEKDNIISYKAVTLIMILSLILHYELRNYELLEHQMIAAYRYLIKKKRLYKYEALALDFIRSSVKNISEKELLEKFAIVREKLIEVSTERNEMAAFEDFDLISWLESKIKGKAFIDVLKEKLKKLSSIFL